MLIDPKKAAVSILGSDTEEDTSEATKELGLQSAASDLLRAVHEKDSKGVAYALRSAFGCLDDDDENEE